VQEDDGFPCWVALFGIVEPGARRELRRRGELRVVRLVHGSSPYLAPTADRP
jgi:hypothetical protein